MFHTNQKTLSKGLSLKTQTTPGAIEFIEFNTKNFSEIENAIKNSDVVINLIRNIIRNKKTKIYKNSLRYHRYGL